MIAFLIEVVKALVTFFAVCVGLGILFWSLWWSEKLAGK